MTRDEFQAAFQALESAALAGAVSIPGALARAAMLGIEYGSTRPAFEESPLIPAPSSPQDRAVRMARQLVATARYSERGACQRALAATPELSLTWGQLLRLAFPPAHYQAPATERTEQDDEYPSPEWAGRRSNES